MASRRKQNKPNSSENGTLVAESPDGKEKFTFFYGGNNYLGNFVPSKFTINGKEFNCVEQYFHYKKAEHFGDQDSMTEILNSESPAEQKKLGRKVKDYDEEEWNKHGPIYMKEGVQAKFEQNKNLRKLFFETAGTTLVEASPRDRKWGIGIGLTNPMVNDRNAWKGKNLLGNLLMEVRAAIMADEKYKSELD